MVCRVGNLAPSTFLLETKLYTITESPSGEPFATTRRYFRVTFVSATLLLEGPVELTEIRPKAGMMYVFSIYFGDDIRGIWVGFSVRWRKKCSELMKHFKTNRFYVSCG